MLKDPKVYAALVLCPTCLTQFFLTSLANTHHFLITLCSLIFTLTPFGWMHSIMLSHFHSDTLWLDALYYANPHPFQYFLWEYFLFMPAISGTLLGNKARAKQNVIKTSGEVEVNFTPSPPTRLYSLITQNTAC
jgi:hypothetical protein